MSHIFCVFQFKFDSELLSINSTSTSNCVMSETTVLPYKLLRIVAIQKPLTQRTQRRNYMHGSERSLVPLFGVKLLLWFCHFSHRLPFFGTLTLTTSCVTHWHFFCPFITIAFYMPKYFAPEKPFLFNKWNNNFCINCADTRQYKIYVKKNWFLLMIFGEIYCSVDWTQLILF